MLAEISIANQDPQSWKEVLAGEREQQYFTDLLAFIEQERKSGKQIYPKNSEIFSSLQFCPFESLKVVILGQDPYHGAGQAHGLCFSVQTGMAQPPSLKNIFKEIQTDLAIEAPKDGSLIRWAEQGVLMLNSVLTVEANRPASHANIGWEKFTDRVVDEIGRRQRGVVFMLWGAYAHKKGARIDGSKHLVLKAAHPSPFSAHSGFFGCKHFSKCNEYLIKHGETGINW